MAKILIVDDSSLSRRALRGILGGAGHDVIEANDGLSALERYFIDKPDLVCLDLVMGGMDGMEVLKKLRDLDNKARVIVATADIQNSTRLMVEAEGASGFVTKPFNADQLLSIVNTVLKGGHHDVERATK